MVITSTENMTVLFSIIFYLYFNRYKAEVLLLAGEIPRKTRECLSLVIQLKLQKQLIKDQLQEGS